MEYLKSFPDIEIRYEKRLHAKYYANEKYGLITSLNLHCFSKNNNIEIGVKFKTKSLLKSITDQVLQPFTSMATDTEDLAAEALSFSEQVFNNAKVIFNKEAQFETNYLIHKKYVGSKVVLDETTQFFEEFKHHQQFESNSSNNYSNNKYGKRTYLNTQTNFISSKGGIVFAIESRLPLIRRAP